MNKFILKKIYEEGENRVLEIDILPGNYCNFNCVFCPVESTNIKGNALQDFPQTETFMVELTDVLENNSVDVVFINSSGESFLNSELGNIIDLVKQKGIKVKLFSNGYFLGEPEHMRIANKCDEMIGEIKCATDTKFQKFQRPLTGYTLDNYISNMILFKQQYSGKFTLIVTIIKGCSDDNESIHLIKDAITQISPDEIIIETMTDDKFGKAFGVSEDRLTEIARILRER